MTRLLGQRFCGRHVIPTEKFAFPDKRKEPLTDARHLRNAIAWFNQVQDVTDAGRAPGIASSAAAKRHDVEVSAARVNDAGRRSLAVEVFVFERPERSFPHPVLTGALAAGADGYGAVRAGR